MTDFRAFSRLLVIELGRSAAGAYCSKLFGDHGAEVVRVGDGPSGPGSDFYDRSVTSVDAGAEGTGATARLLDSADVVIQADGTGPIADPHRPSGPGQVVVRIAPFPASGPAATWRSSDLVDGALSGHLRLSGDPNREPLQGVPDMIPHAAGATAFIAAVAALIAKVRSGAGQVVEVSHLEVAAALHQFTLCRWTHNGADLNRMGNRYAGPGSPIGAYRCRDGWIGLALAQEDQVERMLEVTGLIAMLERPDVESIWHLMTTPGLLDSELVPYLESQPREETVELFQALRLPCAPVAELDQVLADEHLVARRFWHRAPVDGVEEKIAFPGPPFRMSGHRWSLGPKSRPGHGVDLPAGSDPAADLSAGPLAGLRVIDLTRVWAGPLATRILADLGAEVLMTEVPWNRAARDVSPTYVEGTHFFPDDQAGERPWNRNGFHNKYAINKLSAVIDLDKQPGRELLAELVKTADVLVENYSPRVMPGFGFDDESLHRLNPDLVYVTMPGYGRSGPHADWVAYGPTIDGHVGHTSLTGYRDEGPWKCGIAWPDPIGGLHGAAAALVALLDRLVEPGSGGQTIEVAQVESAVHMIGHHLVAAQRDGVPRRWGNRRPGRAPQGVYRCRGRDRWIAISIIDDAAWRGLCRTLGMEDLVELDAGARWDRHDELDRRVEARTVEHDERALMADLQAAGVPAAAVSAAADVMAEPALAAVDFFVELDHPDAGRHPWPRFPARLSATPAAMGRRAPLMGEHNRYAACDLAGYGEAEYRALLAADVLRIEPPT